MQMAEAGGRRRGQRQGAEEGGELFISVLKGVLFRNPLSVRLKVGEVQHEISRFLGASMAEMMPVRDALCVRGDAATPCQHVA